MDTKKIIIVLLHAFAGWALCAAVMAIGPGFFPMETTLIIHAIAAPVFFGLISLLFHSKFGYTAPVITATIFVSFVILVDFVLVAMIILRSADMFRSMLGTWIPFILIFSSTYLTGTIVNRNKVRN